MSFTLKTSRGNLQSVKVCIAAAFADASLQVQFSEANKTSGVSSADDLHLLPTELTQSNAIVLHLGKLCFDFQCCTQYALTALYAGLVKQVADQPFGMDSRRHQGPWHYPDHLRHLQLNPKPCSHQPFTPGQTGKRQSCANLLLDATWLAFSKLPRS